MIDLLKICKDLYKLPRSLTGQGVIDTIEYLKKTIPFKIKHIKSGTKVFDWNIPAEWNIKNAYVIENNSGKNESIFLRSVQKILDENKSKASVIIEKFKVQKNLEYLYEKL